MIKKLSKFHLCNILLYNFKSNILECHEENEKTCMEQHGANSCKKVNGVDTCFCGDSRECDPHKKKKLCLNGQGKKIKGDTEAKCRKGICKFFSRHSTCQDNRFCSA